MRRGLDPGALLLRVVGAAGLCCWRGGLGGALQRRLKDFAVGRGVRGFVAEILAANKGMQQLAHSLGASSVTTDEEGVQHVVTLFEP